MEQNENIFLTPLEFLIGDRFGKYAKYIIQERALPDVRDGLKPVQRRIIYAMLVNGNVPNKPYRKSATAAGFVMGHYHPHGDSSIYEAMVRMSQWWKQNAPLIDMQGNNGSIDDDPPAAMRYTEARLSNISMEILRDIDKDTVAFAPNYDDSTTEPTVLPCKFPNLLVNGAEGIAAGYSTSIPPHNLGEVCKATIFRIKNPKCSIDELMEIIPGPDFPTGGIIRGKENLKECLSNGSGSIQVTCRYELMEQKSCNAMVITEIPFGVCKKALVYSIDKIRADKEIDGIIEVRDESDRNGLRIVVEIRKEADSNSIISYLMKKTKLAVNYNYNVIAICDKKPLKLGIERILDFYIKHEIEVINNRTKFDLAKAKHRHHILEGMVKGISNIDELIHIVRTSHSKDEIKTRIEERFNIDDEQAEAIVTIQLHRLNSVDVEDLIKETNELAKLEAELESIVDNERRIKTIICKELEEIIAKYAKPRLSEIKETVKEFVIEDKPIIKEDCMVAITRDGYFKRSTLKSYGASNGSLPGVKTGDILNGIIEANTGDFLLSFTDHGNYLYIPVHMLSDIKWKDEGKHISSFIALPGDEKIIKTFKIEDFKEDAYVVMATKNSSIKKTKLSEFVPIRYSKPICCMKIKDDDLVVGVDISDGDSLICLTSSQGKTAQYHEINVAPTGLRSGGIKAMKVDLNKDFVAGLVVINKDEKVQVCTITYEGGYKVYNPNLIPSVTRTTKPVELYKFFRSEPHHTLTSFKLDSEEQILGLVGGETILLDFEKKNTPAGKNIHAELLDENRKFEAIGYIYVKNITSKFKTYQVASVEPIQLSEEDEEEQAKQLALEEKEKTKTIFDFLDEMNDDN